MPPIPLVDTPPSVPTLTCAEAAVVLDICDRRVRAIVAAGLLRAWRYRRPHAPGLPILLVDAAGVRERAVSPPGAGRPPKKCSDCS